jgi:S-adenosylmethionine hydrolase
MQIVALLTDYGIVDYYVSHLKGEIYSACPSVNIIDISHNLPPYDINVGSWMLKNTYKAFPAGTIFLARIAEQHYKYQRLLVCKFEGYFFLLPDNGLITMILDNNQPDLMIGIDTSVINAPTNTRHYIRALKDIIYSREITSLGKIVTNYKRLLSQLPLITENSIRGTVMYIDYYGNAITNIHISEFNKFKDYVSLKIEYRRNQLIQQMVFHYADVEEGDDLARFNESGYFEIAMRGDNAAQRMGIRINDKVSIEFLSGL